VTSVLVTGGKFANSMAIQWQFNDRPVTSVNDTGGKIAAGINDIGGKFATGINDTGGKFCHQFH
jgi:hypothetical protein